MSRSDSVDLVVEEVRKSLEDANDARSVGRILRDVMNVITDASAFSVSLFHIALTEVAYRYKVLGPEADASELGRQAVDDGPGCYAARHDRRWHVFKRDLAIRDGANASPAIADAMSSHARSSASRVCCAICSRVMNVPRRTPTVWP
jgi:hypothetical protein